MKQMTKSLSLCAALAFLAAPAHAETIDLRPYFANMLVDGHTSFFAGQMEDPAFDGEEEEDALMNAEWIYQTRIQSESGGITESIQRVVTYLPTPIGTARFNIDSLVLIGADGVRYRRTDGTVFIMGEAFAITNINKGDPMLLPASGELGQTFVTTFERETRMDGGFGMGDQVLEIKRELTLAEIETVTVPAGTFEALRVEDVETFEQEIFAGFTITSELHTTLWFAPGVGLIRTIERESETMGGFGNGGARVVAEFELVEYHERYEEDAQDRLFRTAGSLTEGEFDLLWQPWLGFFERISEDSGWIFSPGLGFLYPLASWDSGGLWFHSADERLGNIYIDDRFVTYAEFDDEETDEFTFMLSGWMFISAGGGSWAYFEADILAGFLEFWPNGTAPSTTIEFGTIFPDFDF